MDRALPVLLDPACLESVLLPEAGSFIKNVFLTALENERPYVKGLHLKRAFLLMGNSSEHQSSAGLHMAR